MRKKVGFYMFDLVSERKFTKKRKYTKKSRLETDSNIGNKEMEDLSLDEVDVETEPWFITGTNGCAAAVKALRVCFKDFLQLFTDFHFTGRLMKVVCAIYQFEHERGGKTRSIFFSREKRYLLAQIEFSKKRFELKYLCHRLNYEHSELRNEVKIWTKEMYIGSMNIPKGVSHFRIVSHLSIISDYFYVAKKRRFEPISMLNTMSVRAVSDYLPIYAYSDFEVVVRFPEGVLPKENDTVIHCVAMEFYGWGGPAGYYFYLTGSGVMVCDVF